MKQILQTLLLLLPLSAMQAQRLAITAVVTEPTCHQNGQICLRVTGGTRPYRYDLDSIGGSIHLSQDDSCFTGRGRGRYQVRVTDFSGRKDSIFVAIVNHYVPMTLNAIQIGGCVKLTVTGGRKPYRYYTHNWRIGQMDTIIGDSTTRMLCCLSNGDYSFKVEDSCHNLYPASLTVTQISEPSIQMDTVSHGDSLDISLIRSTGGEPPYTYICNGDARGSRTNSTGIFTGLKGCEFSFVVTDRCGRRSFRGISFSTAPILTLLCTNSDVGTASMMAMGGRPPYRFLELHSGIQNTTGQFTNLPPHQTYYFMVYDSCRYVAWRQRTPFEVWSNSNGQRCPFTNQIDLYCNIISGTPSNEGAWFPITYTCTNCVPIQTLVDSGNGSSQQLSTVRFQNMAAGDYHFKIVNHCGEMRELDVHTDTGSARVSAIRTCQSNQIRVVNTDGDFFVLKDKWGNSLDSNAIGIFTARSVDTFWVEARRTGCRNSPLEIVLPNTLELRHQFNCYTRTLKLFTDGSNPTFILNDKRGNPLDSNRTGVFQLPVLDTFMATVRNLNCFGRTITIYPFVEGDTAMVCLNLSRQNNAFTWNVVCSANNSSGLHYFRLIDGLDSTRQYVFNNAAQANFNFLHSGTYTLEYDCKRQTIFLPVPDTTYEITFGLNVPCPQDSMGSVSVNRRRIPDWSNWEMQHQLAFCNYQYPELWFVLRDASGSTSSGNSNGGFSVRVNRIYYLSTYITAWNRSFYKLLKVDTICLKYQRPELTALFEPICIGDSTSNIIVKVVNGLPMYTFEIIQPALPSQQTTASNQITLARLPLGTYTIRVMDQCRISADITGSIAPLTVTARYRRECHNHLVLITNELRNATYRWTNRRGDSMGNTPILTLRNAPVDSQTYQVTIFWKNCQWTSHVYVPRNDLQIIQNQIDTTICEEDFITMNGHAYPKAGVFRDTFLNQNGCDSVLILNLRKQNCGYELPNAFAPEMANLYTLYPNPKVAQIEQLTIFDRWGNLIYESEGAFVSGQTGWDGTFQGERVNAGVFVAVVRLVYKNGTRAILKTDLNVLY